MFRFFIVFVIISFGILYFNISGAGENKRAVYVEKRDPFIPLVDEKGGLRKNFQKPQVEELPIEVSFTGISKIKGVFYAIINGELVKEGQMFGEFKVEKIDSDKVILGLGKKKFELRLETIEKKE